MAFSADACAQRVLSLDDCRSMALENNKQLNVARLNQEVALNTRKAARTKYLPRLTALGGYELTSREVSLLNDDQKTALNNLGSNVAGKMGGALNEMLSNFAGHHSANGTDDRRTVLRNGNTYGADAERHRKQHQKRTAHQQP